jgi:anaerobic magnesium-protoporphyrin IX monomethyl ester cyclase
MKKILLISPGHDNEHEQYKHQTYRTVHRDPPPVGILYVASYLIEHGYEIDVIDTHVEDKYEDVVKEYVENNDYIFVGMTIIIGKYLKNSWELTELIRSIKPGIPIVWGGIMASLQTDAILKEYSPDYIVRYDGEETSLELATALENNSDVSNIDGLSYVRDKKIIHNDVRFPQVDLDKFPTPKWEIFGEHFNKEQIPYYSFIMSSRGCPFNCTFCYKHSFDTSLKKGLPAWRSRSAEHIIKEVEYINEMTGTTVFTFGDDNFFVNKKRVLKVLDYFHKKNFYIEECVGHLNCIDDDVIEAIGGIVQTLSFSIETASERLQKYINKKLRLDDIPVKVEKLYKKGILTNNSVIVGLPTEEKEDLRKNVELMLELKKINPFMRGNLYLLFPLPGTEMCSIIENLYPVNLNFSIKEYEEANMWVRGLEDAIGKKFRPWISEERFKLLVLFGYVFNDVFKVVNTEFEERTKEILANYPEINELFKGIEDVNRPRKSHRPYILDKVLKGEKFDLINDLQKFS